MIESYIGLVSEFPFYRCNIAVAADAAAAAATATGTSPLSSPPQTH